MCESAVFLEENGVRTRIVQNIVYLRPEESGLIVLSNVDGEQKFLRARVKEIDFLNNALVLETATEETHHCCRSEDES